MAKKKLDPNIVSTKEAVALALNIPVDHVKVIKKLGCPAAASTGRYYIKELSKWYEQNKDAVIEFLEDDNKNGSSEGLGYWKERKEKANAIIAEITQKELELRTLDKDEIIAWLKQVSGSQAILLRSMSQNLPHKLLGKNITELQVELSTAYDVVCNVFKKELDKWTM